MKNREYHKISKRSGIKRDDPPALSGAHSRKRKSGPEQSSFSEKKIHGKAGTNMRRKFNPSQEEKAVKPFFDKPSKHKGRDTKFKKSFVRVTGKKSAPFTSRTSKADPGGMRLNRYIAHSGICSRRQADDFIKAGLVSVNGVVIKEMGIKIKPGDVVKYNGETIRSEKKVYILLNKPKDYVTSLEDEKGRRTVTDLIRGAGPERVYPVGRLDRNTTGVMLLTNDGELSARLTHPKYNKKKIYHVHLDKNLKYEDLKTVAGGIELEDGPIVPDSITYIEGRKKNEIGIEIHSGRNRIVRRIFETLGYRITKLDRVYFAGLTKKNLPKGKWRYLDAKEINMLKMNAYN